jgi:glycosyltransferase involved in cell wall biosynthesis
VASDLPSIREIAGDGTVLFIEPDDPEKLAAGIRQCIQNGAESRVRAERALRDVTKYSWVTRAESIAAFMRM